MQTSVAGSPAISTQQYQKSGNLRLWLGLTNFVKLFFPSEFLALDLIICFSYFLKDNCNFLYFYKLPQSVPKKLD